MKNYLAFLGAGGNTGEFESSKSSVREISGKESLSSSDSAPSTSVSASESTVCSSGSFMTIADFDGDNFLLLLLLFLSLGILDLANGLFLVDLLFTVASLLVFRFLLTSVRNGNKRVKAGF